VIDVSLVQLSEVMVRKSGEPKTESQKSVDSTPILANGDKDKREELGVLNQKH
jgi:hypothetical protein